MAQTYADYGRLDEMQKAIIVSRFREHLHWTTPLHAAVCAASDLEPVKARELIRAKTFASVLATLVMAGEIGVTAGDKQEAMAQKYPASNG